MSRLSWREILSPFWQVAKSAPELSGMKRLFNGGRAKGRGGSVVIEPVLVGDYLISTDRGLFHATSSRIANVFPFGTFGISIVAERLYATVSIGDLSFVVEAEIGCGSDEKLSLGAFRLLHQITTHYHGERTHQLHARRQRVGIANTKRNALTIIDPQTDAPTVDIHPFVDRTGFPIHTDHNHVNSLYIGEHVLWFVAHNGGNIGSIIGYVHGERVVGAGFPNRGVHDVIPTRDALIYSDTFGSAGADFRGGGNVMFGVDGRLPRSSDGFVVRGVAGTGDELVVGTSHHGRRQDRFKGNGGLIVLQGDGAPQEVTIPCSQVYDIIRLDGRKHDREAPELTEPEARKLLVESVGPIIYDERYFIRSSDANSFQEGRCLARLMGASI